MAEVNDIMIKLQQYLGLYSSTLSTPIMDTSSQLFQLRCYHLQLKPKTFEN